MTSTKSNMGTLKFGGTHWMEAMYISMTNWQYKPNKISTDKVLNSKIYKYHIEDGMAQISQNYIFVCVFED